MPYSKLTANVHLAVAIEQDHLTILANGRVIASLSLSRSDKRQISFNGWILASDIMAQKIEEYHGIFRALDYATHHQNMKTLMGHYGWHIACEYDICQQEAMASDPTYDLKPLEDQSVIMILHQHLQTKAATATLTVSPTGHRLSEASCLQSPATPKKVHLVYGCF